MQRLAPPVVARHAQPRNRRAPGSPVGSPSLPASSGCTRSAARCSAGKFGFRYAGFSASGAPSDGLLVEPGSLEWAFCDHVSPVALIPNNATATIRIPRIVIFSLTARSLSFEPYPGAQLLRPQRLTPISVKLLCQPIVAAENRFISEFSHSTLGHVERISCVPALARTGQCALLYQVCQIAGRSGRRCSGDRAIVPRAQPSLEPFRPLPEHAKKRLLLPLVDLAAQPVQQLCLGDDEFYLPDASALRFQRNFSKPNQPFRDVVLSVGSFQSLVIALLLRQDGRRQRRRAPAGRSSASSLFQRQRALFARSRPQTDGSIRNTSELYPRV